MNRAVCVSMHTRLVQVGHRTAQCTHCGTVDLTPKHDISVVEQIEYGQIGGLHLRCHTASLCGELGLPAQAMQHPIVVKACRGVINVPADALGLCEVEGCAPHRSYSSGWDAILCRGNVVVPANTW